jgi:hypothetical protein
MGNPEYLTREQIVQRLIERRADRKLAVFHAEVERETGMSISKPHLANILSSGKHNKRPNAVVMKYLGGTMEKKTETIYQIDKPVRDNKKGERR